MASSAFSNAMKVAQMERMLPPVEFDLTEDTQNFDLGDVDLTTATRIEVVLNGTVLEDGDWSVNTDDNTTVDMIEAIPADNEINFKIFVK